MRTHLLLTCLSGLLLSVAGPAQAQTEIDLARFFGACEDAGTNIDEATGEACIVQSIINAFSEADNGVTVNTLPTDWGNYYDQLKASYAGGNAPDVHVMHRHRIPEFAGLGALGPIGDGLEEVGVDVDDFTEAAREAITYEDEIYTLPFDVHANLWHVNMAILEEAGLTQDGEPVLPSSPEELLEQAETVKEATGKNYLAADFSQFPIGVRLVLSLIWQQGSNVFEGDEATIDTEEAQNAVQAITQLFDADLADPNLNYADSQQAFLNGEVAVLVNGTWVVDLYTEQAADENVALSDYAIANFPQLFEQPATWADSHMWAIPITTQSDEEKYQAALKLLAFINEHNIDWARTGHIAVRTSVLESEAYKKLPHRGEYQKTDDIARDVPPAQNYGAIQDVLNRELQAIWLTGKPVEQALADADAEVQNLLD